MQRKQATSIPAQRRELLDFAAKQGWPIIKEYVDEGESARTDNRPAFQEMIADAVAKPKTFDQILVYSLDRFARDRYDSGHYRRMLRKAGVFVSSMTERIENTAEGVILESVIEGIAEYYSRRLAVVTKRGQREVALRGYVPVGQPPFGYRATKRQDGTASRTVFEPDPHTAPTVRKIFSMAANGSSHYHIESCLNELGIPGPKGRRWQARTIGFMLSNETYLGRIVYNKRLGRDGPQRPQSDWVVFNSAHEPLVSQELFTAVQAQQTRSKPREHAAPAFVYLLTGLAWCACCGSRIASMKCSTGRGGANYYYVCRRTRWDKAHKLPSLRCDVVESAVLKALSDSFSEQNLAIINRELRRGGEKPEIPPLSQLQERILTASRPVLRQLLRALVQDMTLEFSKGTAELTFALPPPMQRAIGSGLP
ncbi:MAG: recombinase family protein [Candidatus Eremiobacteraeota bacterium]|nr:recombinase family protein [Candidatus Eremiobacteraeota bacterium]